MSHYLTIEDSGDELRLRLTCTATPDAPCRMRPSDDRETWHHDDPDLTPGHECWAVEWAEEGGWETVASADGATWPRIPVTVECDEGVIIAPIVPVLDADGHPVVTTVGDLTLRQVRHRPQILLRVGEDVGTLYVAPGEYALLVLNGQPMGRLQPVTLDTPCEVLP